MVYLSGVSLAVNMGCSGKEAIKWVTVCNVFFNIQVLLKMVKLHIKKGDDDQFLCETTVGIHVDELLANVVAIYNGRLKVQRICAGLLLVIVISKASGTLSQAVCAEWISYGETFL